MLLFSSLSCLLSVLLLQSRLLTQLSDNVHANVCAKDSEREEVGGRRGECGEGGGKTDGIREERQSCELERRSCENVMYKKRRGGDGKAH